MQTISTPANAQAWRDVYVSALFESETGKLPQRIAEAEWALTRRRRELCQATGNNIEEEEALDNAMYSLNALRNVYRCGQAPAQSHAEAA